MIKLTFALIAALLTQAAIVSPALAQTLSPTLAPTLAPMRSSILVLNQDRLLSQTEFGVRIQREVENASITLSAQNRTIEQQLTAEELDLTRQRPLLSAEEFRLLADDFDARVVAIRNAQAATARNLQTQAEAAQQLFFESTLPILLQIVEQRGASVLLDSRSVLLSAGSVDITDAAIASIDERIGRGEAEPLINLPGLSDPLMPETGEDPAPSTSPGPPAPASPESDAGVDLGPDVDPNLGLGITPDP